MATRKIAFAPGTFWTYVVKDFVLFDPSFHQKVPQCSTVAGSCPLVLHSAALPCPAAWSDFLSGLHWVGIPAFLVLRSKVLPK
jgi:hypothetical protein